MIIGASSFRKISMMLILVLIFTGSVLAQNYNQTDSLKKHIYYLASDELAGRKPGTPGIEKAAAYITQQFKNIGIKPFGASYLQQFKLLVGATLDKNNMLKINDKTLKLGTDFIPSEISASGEAEGIVAFAGYGLDKNFGKASYEGIDVKGKWVLVIRGSIDPADRSARALLTGDYSKAMTAADKGAIGVLLVNPAWNNDEKIEIKSIYNRSMGNVNIPVIMISQKVALNIISKSADYLNKFPVDNEPASFVTDADVSAETSFQLQYQTTSNVIGYLEGNDPKLKDEYIVVGGHYDHLGMGGPGSGSRKPDTIAIHNGADDNASGTAGVIELARRIKADKAAFGRSFIFIAFSAEELGLLGSQFFVSNPTVPIASLKGMINLDMIGRLKDELTIEGTGSSAESDSVLTILEKGRPFKVTHSAGAAGGSDHTSFYNKGVPVFFFFSGMHYDYHTPTDKANLINYTGESEILDMAYDLAKVMGTSKPFTYKQVAGQMNTGARTYKVALGIMPDVSGSRNDGVEVMDARKGGPAEQAGIKKGDFIISIEGKEVNNITEYMNRLNLLKKGDKANVGIRRNGEKLIIVVQL
jgi:aminopeptidase YwaD